MSLRTSERKLRKYSPSSLNFSDFPVNQLNFNFLQYLGLIDVLSANEHAEVLRVRVYIINEWYPASQCIPDFTVLLEYPFQSQSY